MTPGGFDHLRELFPDSVIEIPEDDAARYAANSFHLERDGESYLVMPEGVSDALLTRIRERGTTPLTVDVSEFLKKGGGSVKCMIGDLGPVAEGDLREAGGA
jgi:N-dimethylarginine dimethylaminohydrolase